MTDRLRRYEYLQAVAFRAEAAGDVAAEDQALDEMDGLWYAMTPDEGRVVEQISRMIAEGWVPKTDFMDFVLHNIRMVSEAAGAPQVSGGGSPLTRRVAEHEALLVRILDARASGDEQLEECLGEQADRLWYAMAADERDVVNEIAARLARGALSLDQHREAYGRDLVVLDGATMRVRMAVHADCAPMFG